MQLALATPTQRARTYRVETSSIASFLVIAAVVMASLAVVLALDVGEPDHDTTGAQPWLRWPATIIVGGLAAVLLGACSRYLFVRLHPVPTLVNTPLHAVVTRPPGGQARSRSRGVSHRRRPGQRPLGRIDCGCRSAELDRPVFGRLSLAGLPPSQTTPAGLH